MNTSSSLIALSHRGVVSLKGADTLSLLQGLVTNDMEKLCKDPAIFTAWLSPQGRFWHDFFVIKEGQDAFFLTPEKAHIPDFLKRLRLYKLRKNVLIEDQSDQLQVVASLSEKPGEGVWVQDPRTPLMGYVGIIPQETEATGVLAVYDTHRILLGVPDGSRDLDVDKAIILEYTYDALHGISWTKGCYMGQELMARTHHRGEVRKRLMPVRLEGAAQPVNTPLFQGDQKAGVLKSSVDTLALALLRIECVDRALKENHPITTEDKKTRVMMEWG